jgi:phosphate transport system substrate-binding protein
MKHLKRLVLLAVLTGIFIVPSPAAAATIIGSGSVAMQPYIVALAKKYEALRPGTKIIYTANGGNAGIKDVQAGRSQFAGSPRAPLPSDAGTTFFKAFEDGLCVTVNSSKNKLTGTSIQQLRDIYTGKVTSWGAIPKSGLSTTIAPFGRESNAGTFTFWTQAVLNGQAQAGYVNTVLTDGLVANGVKNDLNGIGYIGFPYVKGNLRALKINGIPCDPAHVKSAEYVLSRFLYFVTGTPANADAAKFIDWVRTSADAGVVIRKIGGVTLFNKAVKHKKKHHKKKHHKKR